MEQQVIKKGEEAFKAIVEEVKTKGKIKKYDIDFKFKVQS
jgi:hypothetical protein